MKTAKYEIKPGGLTVLLIDDVTQNTVSKEFTSTERANFLNDTMFRGDQMASAASAIRMVEQLEVQAV